MRLLDDIIRPTLLVGSFPYKTAAETLSVSGPALAGVARRLTDGEPQGWTRFPGKFLAQVDALQLDDTWLQLPDRPIQQYRIKPGCTAADLKFPPAGYSTLVADSYRIFGELRAQGRIAPGTRFQQSLPTPFGIVAMFVRPQDIEAVFPRYQEALLAEVDDIVSKVPHQDFALQWDIAVEVIAAIEGHTPDLIRTFPMDRLAGLVAAAANRVPLGVELGLHFCYGNPGGKHIIEPRDLSNVVAFCNLVTARISRPVTWVHMPVPIARDDAAYFAALRDLKLSAATEFYLGLVHLADGMEGGARRIAAAREARPDFGIATECGFRYMPVESVARLLELHKQLGRLS
jgi:hypothetical protein